MVYRKLLLKIRLQKFDFDQSTQEENCLVKIHEYIEYIRLDNVS